MIVFNEQLTVNKKIKQQSKNLMTLNFQNKVINFTLTIFLSFDVKMIEAKKEDVKMKTSEKWNY